MHVQNYCFVNRNLLLFYKSRCFRRRRCLSSLLLWSRNFGTMVTWRHTTPLYYLREWKYYAKPSVPRVSNIDFLLTVSIYNQKKRLEELTKWSQGETELIFSQILSTNSLAKYREIWMENLNVDGWVLKVDFFFTQVWTPPEDQRTLEDSELLQIAQLSTTKNLQY